MTVLVTRRGVLHRAQAHGGLHGRCAGGRAEFTSMSDVAAVEYAQGRPEVLCRHQWCFRDVLVTVGIDPTVGHTSRHIPKESR